MLEIPQPRSDDEQVFVSCYRFDPLRRISVLILMPVVATLALVAFPCLSWLLYDSMLSYKSDLSSDVQITLDLVCIALGVLGGLIGLGLAFNYFILRRRIFNTVLLCNDQEVLCKTGSSQIQCLWDDVQSLKTQGFGRLQSAVLRSSAGMISIDASLIDVHAPRPKVRYTLTGEKLIYPEGRRQSIRIQDNELFSLISTKTGLST